MIFHDEGLQLTYFTISPYLHLISRLEIDYHQKCQGSRRDPMANHAALLVVQRSDDYIMVPGYDLYNHRNGKYHNTEIRWEDGQPHVTKASRAIQKGEQIYNSYNFCVECEGRRSHYGAAGMCATIYYFFAHIIDPFFRLTHTYLHMMPYPLVHFRYRNSSGLWIRGRISTALVLFQLGWDHSI